MSHRVKIAVAVMILIVLAIAGFLGAYIAMGAMNLFYAEEKVDVAFGDYGRLCKVSRDDDTECSESWVSVELKCFGEDSYKSLERRLSSQHLEGGDFSSVAFPDNDIRARMDSMDVEKRYSRGRADKDFSDAYTFLAVDDGYYRFFFG